MSRIHRPSPAALAIATVVVVTLAGCGSKGGATSTVTSTSVAAPTPTSTAAGPGATVDVVPPSGPIGTSFELRGKFQPQEKVAVEVDLPNGKTFKGQTHTATADGTVTATYRTSKTDPGGTFQVKMTGDHSDQSTGQFEVGTGGATATTKPRATSTTVRGATTTVRNPTTTVRGATSTTKKP